MSSIKTGLLTTLVYRTYTDPDDLGSYLQRMGFVGLKDRVVGVYAVPSNLISTSNGRISNDTANSTSLSLTRPSAIDGYVPKNQKLLTYPYLYATIACGNKEEMYVFEKSYVDSNHTLSFKIYGVMGQGFKIYILPISYDHLPYNFNCAFEDDYPQMPVAITPFIELLGNNGIVSKLLPLALTAATLKVPAPSPMPIKEQGASALLNPVADQHRISGALSNIQHASRDIAYEAERRRIEQSNSDIRSRLDKYHIASHTVPQITGSVNFSDIQYSGGENDVTLAIRMSESQTTGNRVKGVHGMIHSIRARDAEAIDDFFTVYGYTCDKVKVPNVHVRRRFTYTKTQGCRIKPIAGVAGGYMAEICSVFNDGITFWDKNSTIGDYSGNNSPINGG